MQSQMQSQMQSEGLALPLELKVGPSATRASTKKNCVDPSGQDPGASDSEKYRVYVDENLPRLVALRKVYEGSTIIHNVPLGNDQVKVDANACILVPIQEVQLVGQTFNTFLAWSTHLVSWDTTVFVVYNDSFPLYIKHEDLFEIAHDGQCLSISVIQLWILYMSETSMQAGNDSVYGFLEAQSIQRSGQL
ncbi:hypothetical protein GmHk_16G046717 [Glycine max]|nr:hypothetical protein GmHk_16G046717 [Glycine max]